MPPESKRRLLTPAQIETVRRVIADGGTRDEAAAAAGVTPYVLVQRLREQVPGVRLRLGRPRGEETWVEPVGEEEELSRSSLALAPWVAQRAAEIRSRWTEERWRRALARQVPYEVPVVSGLDDGRDFTE